MRGLMRRSTLIAGVTMLTTALTFSQTFAAQKSQASASNDASKTTPYTLTIAFPVFGAIPQDMNAVQTALNKITQAKINTTVKLLPIGVGSYVQQISLMTSSSEKLDLFSTFAQTYSGLVSSGSILPLDTLLKKYGQGITQAVGPQYIKAAAINGKLYGVPFTGPYAQVPAIYMRQDLVKKYHIDVSSIHSIQDLTKVFELIKARDPGITPLAEGLSSPLSFYRPYDQLGDGLGVLPNFNNKLKVVDWYETPQYANLLKLMHKWFQAGYVNKDAATSQTSPEDMVKSGTAFSYFMMDKPGMLSGEERLTAQNLVSVDVLPHAYASTDSVLAGLWTVAEQSQNPARDMMMLKLMYTDKKVANLMQWGIEGKDYVKVSQNVIDYPSGVNASNVGYTPNGFFVGNSFLTYVMKSEDPQLWTKTKTFNKTAIKSKALGFSFNEQPVNNEITEINNVVKQYANALNTGTLDPATNLPQFISALKAAGIDKVVSEKQKQLDAWAKKK